MNPNIALGVQRPRFNTTQDQANALAVQNNQLQQQTNALALQKAQADAARDTRVRNASAQGGGDLRAARGVYAQDGDIGKVMDIDKHLASLDDASRARALGEVDAVVKLAPLMMNKETYGQGYSMLQQAAPGAASRFPAQWTPEAVPAIESMALGAKGLLDKQQFGQTFGETQRHNLAMEARPVAGNQVTVNNAQETSERKEYGKTLVQEYAGVRDRADNAMNERQALEQLKGIDVQTGRLEELRAGIASYAQALGIDPQRVGLPDPTNPQAFIATAQQLVLRVMQAQKGPQTENDAKRIEQTVASIKNTPAAKDFLIDAAIAVRERDIEQADFYDNWRERTGSLDGARKAWRSYVDKTPLMGTNPSSGRPVFFRQFQNAMKQANPDATNDQIMMLWRQKYGR